MSSNDTMRVKVICLFQQWWFPGMLDLSLINQQEKDVHVEFLIGEETLFD
jgi:hypothetical protein